MSERPKDIFKLSRDWLLVQEVVDAVSSPSCGAISVFIGLFLFIMDWGHIYFEGDISSTRMPLLWFLLICISDCLIISFIVIS